MGILSPRFRLAIQHRSERSTTRKISSSAQSSCGNPRRCMTIDTLFPDKSNEYIHSFAIYKASIVNKFKAFYNIGKLDIGNSAKRKFRILILFNKF